VEFPHNKLEVSQLDRRFLQSLLTNASSSGCSLDCYLFVQGKGQAIAVYNNPQAASYAKEKLHGFEYPPGQRLIVKPELTLHADLPM
jgi:hypothetical protein